MKRSSEDHQRIIAYYSPESTTNCYLVIPAQSKDAILIDPTPVDTDLYNLLLDEGLTVATILITHPEKYMQHALKTLAKIFSFRLVAGTGTIFKREAVVLDDLVPTEIHGVSVTSYPFLSHDRSSRVFHVENALFTGTILHAGTLGDTPNHYAEQLLAAAAQDYLKDLPDPTLVLPAVGPPSTVRVERELNPYFTVTGE